VGGVDAKSEKEITNEEKERKEIKGKKVKGRGKGRRNRK